ncbi:DUF4476 domain-containing protein [Mucilaginibacter mali]|uniref:DUF4476 domain-containing protein n=1 Tax=Mucilaginibacter mali TaxID=2740462 RepID=A0A7D4PRW7_9SPHI|nr:DUF4476 domain-containing protein [Mucilaginibacter mali]QKJ28543.1 DUF4476 domain-containing protein [Mucilaginibacter mali]
MKKYPAIFIALFMLMIGVVNAQTKAPKASRPTQAMDNGAIDGILTAMKNQRGDEAKLEVLQRFMKNNVDGMMVDQQLRLLNQFATDDAKLECAKFAYPRTVDPQNYSKIQYNIGNPAIQKTLANFVKKQGK